MKTKDNLTWLGYFDIQQAKSDDPDQLQLADFEEFFLANNIVHSFLRHSTPSIYLLDYKKRTYLNMSENCAGYKAESFLRGGVDHTLEIYDPLHLRLLNNEIFPDRLTFLAGVEPENHKNYVFSFIQNVKNLKGEDISLLQRNCFVSDELGNPLFSVGIVFNINLHIPTQPVVQTIEKIDSNGLSCDTIARQVYYLNGEDKLLSKREKEVLQWMAEGLSSKMIAEKMFLSEFTVINHRRNMQDKTNTPNAIALVSFAIRNGLI
ncbi:response regulator transcription factor [Pedobacter hiemivivus]|uniref:LuxR family transcriptional regulator n=1 Tax=Pedobacter hiemivivus TaxID=2530454 RepID=A0A4R0MA87_9SPHI|nr:LuxR C-terminal-related transcriptional regulator [Pedobacter hiemivivus]TCC82692.1 LuxR family transcriptional regulator [Pedobacter hiemivivus]